MVQASVPPGVDPAQPSPARLYDYYLGGSHYYEADRLAAEQLRESMPELMDLAWANRGFHQRVARWMAGCGIRQFIDIGSGLPTVGNTHEVVEKVAPDARVVYVDNDPMVLACAEEVLTDPSLVRVVLADMREPDKVLGAPDLNALIDFDQPAGLLMTAVLHFVADSSDPWGLVRRYVDALAPGSYLALSHGTLDFKPARSASAIMATYEKASENGHPRTKREVARFFEGLELLPPYPGARPDIVHVGEWGAEDPSQADSDGSRWSYCGVARCP
jgi:trans-aconitate methyltransferase